MRRRDLKARLHVSVVTRSSPDRSVSPFTTARSFFRPTSHFPVEPSPRTTETATWVPHHARTVALELFCDKADQPRRPRHAICAELRRIWFLGRLRNVWSCQMRVVSNSVQ